MSDKPNKVVEINGIDEFNNLTEKNLKTPIVIDFWAPWCGPCKAFKPVFEKAFEEWGNYFIFARVNTESNPAIAQQLGIMGVPTIGFVKGNKLIQSVSGGLRKGAFDKLLTRVKQNIENEGRNVSRMYS